MKGLFLALVLAVATALAIIWLLDQLWNWMDGD